MSLTKRDATSRDENGEPLRHRKAAGVDGPGVATAPTAPDWSQFDEILQAKIGWRSVDFAELYRSRDLFIFWTIRGLKARHAQSALGVAWAVIQPLVNTIIFTVVFGRLVGVASDGVPYVVFALVGLVIWTFFSNALRDGVESLTRYTQMLSKIYFPRLILPLSAVLGKLLDLAVASLMLIPVMIWYGLVPRVESIAVLPLLLLILVLSAVGLTLWLSALAVQYRDVMHAMVFALQAIMYLSPVVYSDRIVPGRFRLIYGLNPLAGVIGGARSVLLDAGPMPWDLILPGALTALVLAVSGLYYFRGRERLFADVA